MHTQQHIMLTHLYPATLSIVISVLEVIEQFYHLISKHEFPSMSSDNYLLNVSMRSTITCKPSIHMIRKIIATVLKHEYYWRSGRLDY